MTFDMNSRRQPDPRHVPGR